MRSPTDPSLLAASLRFAQVVLVLLLLLPTARAVSAQPTEDPPPAGERTVATEEKSDESESTGSSESEDDDPTGRVLGHVESDEPVVPPEGPGDSWGYLAVEGVEAEIDEEATEGDDARSRQVEIVRARLVDELGHRWVTGIDRLERDGARPEWSRQGDRIAFDAANDFGARELHVLDLDLGSRRCITCDHWDLRKKNVLSPTWHPSGEWLVVTVQDLPRRLQPSIDRMATVERGYHADLWAVREDGKDAWRITRSSEDGRAVLEAHFSWEGDRIAWSERVDSSVGGDGAWVVRVAEISMRRGVPFLDDVETYRPTSWPARVVVDGFTPDDHGLWISFSPRGRRGALAGRYDLETRQLKMVEDAGRWTEEPREVPRGERIVYASDRGLDLPRHLPRVHDLWFTTPTGRNTERLTYFNDPSADHHLGEALIADLAWSPDGDALLLHVVSHRDGRTTQALWRVAVSTALVSSHGAPE